MSADVAPAISDKKSFLKRAPLLSREMRSSSGRLLQPDPFVVNRVWNDGNKSGSSRDLFLEMYKKERAPWDIERPQPAVVAAQSLGFFKGRILDLGFALGNNAIFLAQHGHVVVGVDVSPEAVEDAVARLAAVGSSSVTDLCDFRVGDVLHLDDVIHPDDKFDTLVDVGLFHSFSDEQQEQYIKAFTPFAKEGAKLVLVCFSDENDGDGWHGPRRLSEAQIRAMLTPERGWRVDSVSNTRIESNPEFMARSTWTGRSIAHFVIATRI